MNTTSNYPDGITARAVTSLVSELSHEIASPHLPTSDLADGSAVARRNARMLARAAAGITAKYGVTLSQALEEAMAPVRPVPVATLPTPIYGTRKRKGRRARRNAARVQVVRRATGTDAA